MFDHNSIRARQEHEFSESIKHLQYTMADFRALHDLMLLLEENNETLEPTSTSTEATPQESSVSTVLSTTGIDFIIPKKFKPKSQKFPDLSTNFHIWAFLVGVVSDIKRIQVSPYYSNLTFAQKQAISKLSKHSDLVIKA